MRRKEVRAPLDNNPEVVLKSPDVNFHMNYFRDNQDRTQSCFCVLQNKARLLRSCPVYEHFGCLGL